MDYINKNGLGYLEIVGELVCSVDEETGNNISLRI
jgi:hypothetical protein